VPQYIDRQMGTPWADGGIWYMQGPFFAGAPEFGYQSQLTPKQQYRSGIKAIDTLCQQQLNSPFAALTAAQQDDVLKQIEKGGLTSTDLPLSTFFSGFLLRNVMEGYFGDPMYGGNKDMAAWKMIGYPGVRADYLEWVGEAKPYPYGPVSIYGKRG
jgi:gluconate 2-dehydrogenase gamma chain